MKVLIPLTNDKNVFHDNLFRAPLFAEYTIDTHDNVDVYYTLKETFSNPFGNLSSEDKSLCDNHGMCDVEKCTVQHLKEHNILSKSLKYCDYILLNRACETMTDALFKEGINVYHISPFLHKADIAIKNFLLGVSIASKLQNIHSKA